MEEKPTPTHVQPEVSATHVASKRRAVRAFIAFLVVVVIVSALAFWHASKQSKATTPPAPAVSAAQAVHVSLTANGFVPKTVTVSPGSTVKWTVTDSSATHIIASDPYPADNILSGLKSKQLGNGATYSYTFTSKGTYTYHDDLRPTVTGSVIVK